MSVDGTPEPTPAAPRRSRRVMHVCISAPAALLVVYLMSAYVFIPMAWSSYAWRHPAVDDAPRITRTGNGIPGDPLNIALIGTEDAIGRAMIEAGWRPADPITLKTCLRITHSTLLKRPYEQAPVSNLYLYGRKQDLAFQRAVGDNPRQRHHVRFWCAAELDDAGRPLWFKRGDIRHVRRRELTLPARLRTTSTRKSMPSATSCCATCTSGDRSTRLSGSTTSMCIKHWQERRRRPLSHRWPATDGGDRVAHRVVLPSSSRGLRYCNPCRTSLGGRG